MCQNASVKYTLSLYYLARGYSAHLNYSAEIGWYSAGAECEAGIRYSPSIVAYLLFTR